MALRHALLGLLSIRPLTGYELKKQFDGTVRHFWTADQAQIYRTLYRLDDEGLVESQLVPQEGRADRREYRITADGVEELERWLRTAAAVPPDREPFLAQLFFAGRLTSDEIVRLIDGRIALTLQGLASLRGVATAWAELAERGPSTQTELLTMATLERGVRQHLTELAWLRDVRHDVLALAKGRAGAATGPPAAAEDRARRSSTPRSWMELRRQLRRKEQKP